MSHEHDENGSRVVVVRGNNTIVEIYCTCGKLMRRD